MAFLIGMIAVALGLVSVCGEQGVESLLAPGTLFSVVGLTYLLGRLTFEGQSLRAIFLRAVRSEVPGRSDGTVMGTLAMYGLVSGVVLGILQVLAGGEGVQGVGLGERLRPALISLLYGVLVALGLWVLCVREGQRGARASDDKPAQERRQVAVGVGGALLVVVVVGLALQGVRVRGSGSPIAAAAAVGDLGGQTAPAAKTDAAAMEDQRGVAEVRRFGPEVRNGLELGTDLMWRPQRRADGERLAPDIEDMMLREGFGRLEGGKMEVLPVLRWEPAGAGRGR